MDVADFFFELDDPRQDGKCYHVLSDIVLIVMCGYLADCEVFVEVYDYACDKQETLREFLELPCGIPSHDTLGRVFCLLDPLQLESLLMEWGEQIVGMLVGKQLAVDGKQLRGTIEADSKQASVQIVSVWAQGKRLWLAQSQIADKTNEITANPELLRPLDIKGALVSIDAIGCQKDIVELIVGKEADYLISLKENQDGLYEQVSDWFERVGTAEQVAVSRDQDHGRAKKRTVKVCQQLDMLDAAGEWEGLSSIVCVEICRWLNGKEQRAKRCFISSLSNCNAELMGRYVRQNWGVENHQHRQAALWHLDVTFEEDGCTVRRQNAPRNLTTIRKLALGLISREPTKISLRRKRKKAARDDQYLKKILSQLCV